MGEESEGFGFDSGKGFEAASLPPRKRLLAGLKNKENGWGMRSSGSSSTSSSAASTVVNSPTLGPEDPNPNLKPSIDVRDMAKTSKAAALAATETAAIAKRIAVEKASSALKAAAAAKSALELAASAAAREEMESKGGFCVSKSKPTKHVPIKLLYKGKTGGKVDERSVDHKSSSGGCSPVKKHEPIKLSYKGKRIETKGGKEKPLVMPSMVNDEELARELHRAMNSSPRISRNLDRQYHFEKPANSACCLPTPSKVNRLRVKSSVSDVFSDGKDGVLGDCGYSKFVASNDNNWPLHVEVASSNKLAESVSEAMDEENYESKELKSEIAIIDEENCDLKEHKLEVHIMDEEASCLFQCNGTVTKQHSFDTAQAISESKVGQKRSRDPWQIEESYKCARVQPQAENHQENHLAEETKGSLLTNGSTFRSHAKQSNIRRNSERRMRSISGDFPQVSKLSADSEPTWRRKTIKPSQVFPSSLNLSSMKSSSSVPPIPLSCASRATRRHSLQLQVTDLDEGNAYL